MIKKVPYLDFVHLTWVNLNILIEKVHRFDYSNQPVSQLFGGPCLNGTLAFEKRSNFKLLLCFQMIDDGCSSGDDDDNNFSIDWLNIPPDSNLKSLHNSANLSPVNNGAQKRSNSRRNKPTVENLTDEERKIR
jgi:hypothetical protein